MDPRPVSQRKYSTHHHFGSLEEYVKELGGTRPIRKVLIANNGIGAVKAIRSMRRWAYETFGNEREVLFVSMATPEDLRANAEYIRMADEFVEVPGGSNANNYANVNLIVQVAQRYKVDAVWAGWGHASENPALPNTLTELDIVFIGPPGAPMYALGDKIGSTIIAQSARVPTIAWNGQDLSVDYKKEKTIPPELYEKANIKTVEQCIEQIKRVGLPVMIKASEGGGGKGIRKVTSMDQIETAFRQVQGEIPGSPIFVMRLAPRSRHLEVQLLADIYGNAIALSGRDCSVQRRHQKILEEGPPLAAPKPVWDEMCKAAVRLAKEVGYVNAGTVEYLYYDGKFFFLELNPRLQVEHPVTEMITQVNLPAAQLNVAMGIPLDRINCIRKLYGREPYGHDPIDFDNEVQNPPDGHVIAARITAENANEGFTPTSGPIQELNFRSSPNVWGYFSVDSSGRVHEFADSQIGHLFSWGNNREDARRNLVIALHDLSIRGDIRTTVEYLQDLLEADDYKNFNFDTSWLDQRIKANVKTSKIDPITVVLCGAACQGFTQFASTEKEYIEMLERGQLPPSDLLKIQCQKELIYESIKYRFTVAQSGPNRLYISCNGSSVDAEVRALADGGFLVLLGGKSHVAYTKDEVGAQRFIVDGQTCLFAEEYDPTRLRAQMGGKLLRYLVQDGAAVEKNQPFAEIEVMKMNMQLTVKESGVITMLKPEGAVMEPGDLICTIELDDPSKVKQAKLFESSLPELGEPWPRALETMPHNSLGHCKNTLQHVIDGYYMPEERIDATLAEMTSVLKNPLLPILEIEEILSRIKNIMPYDLFESVTNLGSTLRSRIASPMSPSSLRRVSMSDVNLEKMADNQKAEQQLEYVQTQNALKHAEEYCRSVITAIEAYGSVDAALQPLVSTAKQYADGFNANFLNMIGEIMARYLKTENSFAELELAEEAEKDDVLQELRKENLSNLHNVFELSRSHASMKLRNSLMLKLFDTMERIVREAEEAETEPDTAGSLRECCVDILQKVGSLASSSTTDVALEARQLLIELNLPSHKNQLRAMESKLRRVAEHDEEVVEYLVNSTQAILHFLVEIVLTSKDIVLRKAALEIYIRRLYNCYEIDELEIKHDEEVGDIYAEFLFHAAAKDSVAMGEIGMAQASSYDNLTALLTDQRAKSIIDETGTQGSQESSSVGLDLFEDSSVGASNAGQSSLSSIPPLSRQPDAKPNRMLSREARAESATGDQEPGAIPPYVRRKGSLSVFANTEALKGGFKALLRAVHRKKTERPGEQLATDVMHTILNVDEDLLAQTDASSGDAEAVAAALRAFLSSNEEDLNHCGIRRVTFATAPTFNAMKAALVAGHGCGFYTYRHRANYREDRLVRDIETPLAFQLELQRLANFNISLVPLGKNLSMAHSVQVYEATPKVRNEKMKDSGKRFFVRALVRQVDRAEGIESPSAHPGPERVFVQALAALEAVKESNQSVHKAAGQNHVFLNILGDATVAPEYLEKTIKTITRRYETRLRSVGVSEVELKLNATLMDGMPPLPYRIIATNPTGFALSIARYVEAADPSNPERSIFYYISDGDVGGALAAMGMKDFDEELLVNGSTRDAELHGKPLTTPYSVTTMFDEKRARAAALGTAYAYDFPTLFERSVQLQWKQFRQQTQVTDGPQLSNLMQCDELVLDDEMTAGTPIGHGLCLTKRNPGTNTVAMLAWKMTVKTPQYPEGRDLVLICNDITTVAGSFGTREDEVFKRATTLAVELGIPRIYIAANSGARLGMADEVKRAFKVEWNDPEVCSKGFKYIYVTPEDYAALGPQGKKSLLAEYVQEKNHYKVVDIIGEAPDLGVENLRGSGTIAGETSRAYNDTFTLTYVSGRTVGIGAYLVRLGQRTIQKGTNAPILLTGYQALNSIMGREVYTSNLQLGGTKVMYNNGVSHTCVRNDLDGVREILQWLTYVPKRKGDVLPFTALPSTDTVERDVLFDPTGLEEYDPRLLLTGQDNAQDPSDFVPGFFDRHSFKEYLAGWAKSVVVGRARLGGIPMGVIVSEIRTMEAKIPADPANPDSKECSWQQAGQVWYPDSAYKTAQAISDFNKENLPLMLFANWRGFSGGQRDMFDEVLKYGSFIVDELVAYREPVFIYIPPGGQLRGGAWVVVDPTINSEYMEMYADTEARGNVLEPPAIASIKFREKDIRAAAHRIDPVLKELDAKLKDGSGDVASLKAKIKEREKKLFPTYKQISCHFADLHDRPGRMLAKGVIRDVVPWKQSRRYFYHRLRRRLLQNRKVRELMKAGKLERMGDGEKVLEQLCKEDWSNDQAVHDWLASTEGEAAIAEHSAALRGEMITKEILSLGQQDSKAVLKGLMGLIDELKKSGKVEERDDLVKTLRKGVMLLQ